MQQNNIYKVGNIQSYNHADLIQDVSMHVSDKTCKIHQK